MFAVRHNGKTFYEQRERCERGAQDERGEGGRGKCGGLRGRKQTDHPGRLTMAICTVCRRRVGRSVHARSPRQPRNNVRFKPPRRKTGTTNGWWRAIIRYSNRNPKHVDMGSCPQPVHLRNCRNSGLNWGASDLQSDALPGKLSQPMQNDWCGRRQRKSQAIACCATISCLQDSHRLKPAVAEP